MPTAMMNKACLLSEAGRRVAQALLAAHAAPDYPLPGLGLRFDDIEALAPGAAQELGLTEQNLSSMDSATRARLAHLLAVRISD